jgi:hypothetical protein
MQRWQNILILVAAGFLLILPAIINGIPKGNDLTHHYRLAVSLEESLQNGELRPGWNSRSGNGYGDVSFRFYPPAFYYFLSLARFATGDWYAASLLVFMLLSILGGLGVYYWAQIFLKPKLALCAGLCFMVTPYHVNELYQSSLLPEYAGCAVLPFAFAFVELVCQTGKAHFVMLLALAYAMLLLTHLPLFVIGSLALSIYALCRIKKTTYLKSFAHLTVALLLGLAASAFYWVTMIAELDWRRGNKINADLWFDYRYNFLFGKQLEGATTGWATLLAICTLLIALPAFVLLKKSTASTNEKDAASRPENEKPKMNSALLIADEKSSPPFKALTLVTLVAFFMMVPLSRPVWAVVPFLKEVQFPWRWLAVASLGCSILSAASLPGIYDLAKSKWRPLAILAAGCLIIGLSLTMFQVIRSATFLPRPTFNSMTQTIASSPSLPDWLPIWANPHPQEISGEIEVHERGFSLTSWQATRRTFQVDAGTSQEARVRTYYYPHWVATADGKALKTRPADDGALLITLPSAAVNVELNFCEPPRAALANILSLMTWLAFSASALWLFFKRRSQAPSPKISKPKLLINHPS